MSEEWRTMENLLFLRKMYRKQALGSLEALAEECEKHDPVLSKLLIRWILELKNSEIEDPKEKGL